MRWVGNVTPVGEMRNAYKILVGELERKRLLGRPRRRWEDNIRVDLRKPVGRYGPDSSGSGQRELLSL
jgi:hypothetical protein